MSLFCTFEVFFLLKRLLNLYCITITSLYLIDRFGQWSCRIISYQCSKLLILNQNCNYQRGCAWNCFCPRASPTTTTATTSTSVIGLPLSTYMGNWAARVRSKLSIMTKNIIAVIMLVLLQFNLLIVLPLLACCRRSKV